MNLIVDIGNTLTKTALFDAEGFETEAPVVEFSAGWVDALLQRRPQIERAIVASTRGEEVRRRTVELLRRRIGRVVELSLIHI